MSKTFPRRDLSQLPDYCAPTHAAELIARIKAVWAEKAKRFHAPTVEVRNPFESTHGKPRVDVRSDMVDGMPRKRLEGEA